MIRSHEFNDYPDVGHPANGVVILQMAVKSQGLLAQPDDGKVSDEIGRVCAVGGPFKGIYLGRQVISNPADDIKHGDVVIVKPGTGFTLDGFGWDDVGDGVTKIYGSNGGPGSFVPFQRYAFDEFIMGVIENDTVRAVGKRLTIKLGPVIGEQGGIILTDRSKKRDPVCEVLSVGSQVTQYKPGDKIICSQNAIDEFSGDVRLMDIGSIHEDAVLSKR